MITLSPKQRQIRKREARILTVARQVYLREGYYGMTMANIAKASDCPTGTVYQHFASKEDIILALALQCQEKRFEMIRRGASYQGRPRERIAGVGEAVALFVGLHRDESRIIHNAGGPLREKASAGYVEALARMEKESVEFLRRIVQEAVDQGDLELKAGASVEQITFGIASLVDGGYALVEESVPQDTLGLADPAYDLWRIFNMLADAYGWRPLYTEVDWNETLAQIRKSIFPDEAQRLYGESWWYAGRRRAHRSNQ